MYSIMHTMFVVKQVSTAYEDVWIRVTKTFDILKKVFLTYYR